MKRIFLASLVVTTLFTGVSSFGQTDKSKRPSPPDKVSATTSGGNTITIDYSQPSIKGRTIGTDLAPYGKVWRTGANEATVFEITSDAKIEGKYPLPAGKYGLYSIPGEQKWTMIFNKTWDQWGTRYSQGDDALRVEVETQKSPEFKEKMTFQVNDAGLVTWMWGDKMATFTVK